MTAGAEAEWSISPVSAVCDAVVKLIVDSNYRENRGAGSNVMGQM